MLLYTEMREKATGQRAIGIGPIRIEAIGMARNPLRDCTKSELYTHKMYRNPPGTTNSQGKPYLFVAVLLLLLAFGLRVHRWAELGTQADEGVHIVLADRLVAGDALFRDLFWNHVPGFDLLLAATFAAIGSSVLFSRF